MSESSYLTNDQYKTALTRIRDKIAAGELLKLDDCTDPGAKHTHCSWGMCTNDMEVWAEPEMHLFPKDLPNRCSAKYQAKGQYCPMDRDATREDSGTRFMGPDGCFWRCRLFRPKKKDPSVVRATALALYDEMIKKADTLWYQDDEEDEHEALFF